MDSWLEEARVGGCVILVAVLSACGGGGGGATTQQLGAPDTNAPLGSGTSFNSTPSIFGTPATNVRAGSSYVFTPAATDPDVDPLTYSIANKPGWASFSTVTGTLSGNPDDSALGTTFGVVISVSDGMDTAALPRFDLTVTPNAVGGLPVSNTQPDRYEWTVLQDGQKAFIDRDFRFGDVPSEYEGLDFLRTANNDKFLSTASAISFDVAMPVTVYVAYDSRIQVRPDWLGNWTNTGDHWDGDQLQTDVYRKDFPAGPVALGGNEMGFSMYNVAIGPPGGLTPPPVAPPNAPSPSPPATTNTPPTISGTPAKVVTANNGYDFRPTASDSDGDRLTFSISNKPRWASFSSSTGRLSGSPGTSDVGFSGTIFIRVSDGKQTAALPGFSITVSQPPAAPPPPPGSPGPTGSATVTWDAPTQNSDGTRLTDLAGFRIYYSETPGSYGSPATVRNPGVTAYTIDNLSQGTWYFVVTAFDTSGNESARSNTASKTILPQ